MAYFSATESNKKTAVEKNVLSLNPETITDVLYIRLAPVAKFISLTMSSDITLLPYYKRTMIEKLDV